MSLMTAPHTSTSTR